MRAARHHSLSMACGCSPSRLSIPFSLSLSERFTAPAKKARTSTNSGFFRSFFPTSTDDCPVKIDIQYRINPWWARLYKTESARHVCTTHYRTGHVNRKYKISSRDTETSLGGKIRIWRCPFLGSFFSSSSSRYLLHATVNTTNQTMNRNRCAFGKMTYVKVVTWIHSIVRSPWSQRLRPFPGSWQCYFFSGSLTRHTC